MISENTADNATEFARFVCLNRGCLVNLIAPSQKGDEDDEDEG